MKTAHSKNDVWLRVFWKWVRKGADRSYAVWMADRAEKRGGNRHERKLDTRTMAGRTR
jgi:hypothetical protein